MRRRRRLEEEELEEREQSAKPQLPQLAELDEGKRAGILEEIQSAGGNKAFSEAVSGQQLQRETAPAPLRDVSDGRTYMTVEGIKGPEVRKGHEGQFEVEKFDLEQDVPHDPGTGLPTGVRRLSEAVVVVRKSTATPKFRQALATNQVLEKITIDDGIEKTALSKVTVVGVKEMGAGKVQLRFVYKEIGWTAGDVEFTDEWGTQGEPSRWRPRQGG
jgi:type VI secretion system Hcp family effector